MERRKFIAAAGTALTGSSIAFAGCGEPGAGPEETPTEEDGGAVGDGETPTEEETETPAEEGETETPTEEETETPTEEETETTAEEGETETTAGGDGGTTISMVTEEDEYFFDPIGLHVESGDTVTWEIESGSHSSTAYSEENDAAETTLIPEDAESWDSGTLSESGATFEHTFETEGTYDYFCIPHKTLGMVGRIVVGEPGGPAEGQQPPDGEVPESQAIVDQGSISYDDFSS